MFLSLILLQIFNFAMADYKIATYNIRNFDYDQRYNIHTNKGHLKEILTEISPELLAVQEINNVTEFKNYIKNNFPLYDAVISECGGAHGQRLGFVYKTTVLKLVSFEEDLSVVDPGTNLTQSELCTTGSRPLAVATFKDSQKKELIGMAVHFKSGGNPDSLKKRLKQIEILKNKLLKLRETGHDRVVVMGDFNTTEYLERGDAYKQYVKAFNEAKVNDLTQNTPCSAYWWGGVEDGTEDPSLLDHVLVTPELLKGKNITAMPISHCQRVQCKEVPTESLGMSYAEVSDHCPIVANLK
jgi:endonuclease/exonuclease/phosphatase family metal-dependent hydrolase